MLNSENIPNRPDFLQFFLQLKIKKIIMKGEISKEEFRKNKNFYIKAYVKDGKYGAYVITPFDDGKCLYFVYDGEILKGVCYHIKDRLSTGELDRVVKGLKRVIMDSWIDIDSQHIFILSYMN